MDTSQRSSGALLGRLYLSNHPSIHTYIYIHPTLSSMATDFPNHQTEPAPTSPSSSASLRTSSPSHRSVSDHTPDRFERRSHNIRFAGRRRQPQHHRRRSLPDGGRNGCFGSSSQHPSTLSFRASDFYPPGDMVGRTNGEIGSSGRGYPVSDTVAEGSLAVRAAGCYWGEQGRGEDGGVCRGCGRGFREADGG